MSNNVKKIKAKKADEMRRNDVRLYRLMVEFVLVILAVTASVMLGNFNNLGLDQQLKLHNSMLLAVAVTGILFAASAVFYAVGKNNSESSAYKIITRAGIFGNLAILFFGCLHFYLFYDAENLIIALIAAAVVYFTFNIFEGELLDYSLITAAGFILLELAALPTGYISKLGWLIVHGSRILAFVLPVAAIVYAIVIASKNKGKKTALLPIIVSSVLTVAGAALNFIYPAAAIYAVFGLVGCYLVVIIAHTVKNM